MPHFHTRASRLASASATTADLFSLDHRIRTEFDLGLYPLYFAFVHPERRERYRETFSNLLNDAGQALRASAVSGWMDTPEQNTAAVGEVHRLLSWFETEVLDHMEAYQLENGYLSPGELCRATHLALGVSTGCQSALRTGNAATLGRDDLELLQAAEAPLRETGRGRTV